MRVAMLLHKSVANDSRVRREASALVAAGHAVTVLELDPDAGGELDGFSRVSVSPAPWVRRALPFQAYRVVFLASFIRHLSQIRPDVVHAHDAAMLLPGLLGARLTGAKLVYDSHELATGVPYREGAWARFVRGIERLAIPRCAAVITVTDGIAARLQHLYGLRSRPLVLRNVTDLEPPAGPTGALRARLDVGDAPIVLHQGAPAPDRGGEQLIAALVAVPDAHLVFLGSSPFAGFEAGLREQAESTGVRHRVHFLPSVPLADLLAHTVDADVGVSLLQDTCENHRLALPNKLFEYLAAGVPVVVSDLPEVAGLVRAHDVGWPVAADRPEAIGEGLRHGLAARGDRQLSERIRAAGAELTWAAERGRLHDLYSALARAPARQTPRTEQARASGGPGVAAARWPRARARRRRADRHRWRTSLALPLRARRMRRA
jgi:glycosyltransferase involved in cell wall biosynthesis